MKILHIKIPDFENEEERMQAQMFLLCTAVTVLKAKNELSDLWNETKQTYVLVPDWLEETIMEKAEHLGITKLLEDFMVFKTIE